MTRYLFPTDTTRHIGTFVKTPAPHIVEILGRCGLDFCVLDAEHAPFDRGDIDLAVLAGHAVGMPVFVRTPDARAATLLSVLDTGATGLLVPHVDTPEDARRVVDAAKYVGGSRGYSGSSRHGGYGTKAMRELIPEADACGIVCQIESALAAGNAVQIARVPGVDAVFIGRADLALSMGLQDPRAAEVTEVVTAVIRDVVREGKRVGIFVASSEERDHYAAQGASWFVQGSDQSLLRDAARAIAIN